MRAPFRSGRHAAWLALALAVPLLAPALLPEAAQPARSELYSAAVSALGPYPWLERQAFREHAPISLLFAGSSHIWSATDNPELEAALHRAQPAAGSVRTIGWPRSGYDIVYFIAKDVLSRRPVKVLVLTDEISEDKVQAAAHRWFRFADEPAALAGIPWSNAAALYAASVLGMPRNLLSLLRPNRESDPAPLRKNNWQSHYRADEFAERLGALSAHVGYDYDPEFESFEPPPPAARAVRYSSETGGDFEFSDPAIPPYKWTFLQRVAALARAHGTTLVFLDIPTFNERRNPRVTERLCWPRVLPGRVRIIGVPPARLFEGLSDDEVRRLYYDEGHLNYNGQRFFTAAIAPALLEVASE